MSRCNPRRANGSRRDAVVARVRAAYETCAICGGHIDRRLKTPHPLSAEVDEIVPVSRGGSPYMFSNCRLTHRQCNRMKSNRSDAYARAQMQGSQIARATAVPFEASEW
ncbi:HNH endonuclease signature motif containing protein [Bifidobacterium sp.]|uniref:HNH endonuclease signature motif containing protein n=1 Tax=Bifidobacterium sp. TaxID=41200 RepID=UPI0039EB7E74